MVSSAFKGYLQQSWTSRGGCKTYASEDLEVVNEGLLSGKDLGRNFVSVEDHGHWERELRGQK